MSDTLTSVSNAKKSIEKILSDRETELADLEQLIDADDTAIEAATAQMDEATAACDITSYREAKAALTAARDAREMHGRRKTYLEDKPLITAAEYEETTAAIVAEVAARNDETKQTLVELAEQMKEAGAELGAVIDDANETLGRLQHDIYRDGDRKKDDNGNVIGLESDKNCVKDYTTVQWSKCGVQHYMYKEYLNNSGK